MGIKIATNVFQAAMSTLFNDLDGSIIYLDDIIILNSGTCEEHMKLCMKCYVVWNIKTFK